MDKVTVHMTDGYVTDARTETHTWHADLREKSGGTNEYATPEEMLLGALGSCMAQTAKLYATRKGWSLDGVDVTLEVERHFGKDYPDYEGDETYVHEIREKVVFHGDLDDDQRARLREITGKCPVRRIISTPTFFKDLEPETA